MIIQQVFNTRAVETIERKIVKLADDSLLYLKDCSRNVSAIQDLLSERKSILDKMFVMEAERLFSVLVCLAMSKR